jgi:hypothetical protein
MKLWSRNANYTLLVIPTEYVTENGRRRTVRGLRAEFAENMFDSHEAQKKYRWTEEERRLVEEALIDNPDFGVRYHPLDDDPTPVIEKARKTSANDGMCEVTFMTPEGAVRCSNKSKGGSPYCNAHQTIAAKLGDVEETTDAEEPAPVGGE